MEIKEKKLLVDIDPNLELPSYKLVLCKLNEELLMELENVDDKTYSVYYIDIDEFSFTVPKYIMDNGEKIENYIYHYVDGDHLILLNDAQYFYINNVKETSDDNGIEYKDVHCYSREFLLVNKKVRGYKADSRKLYDYNNTKDENGLEIGVMNYVERRTSWKVGYINANLLNKYRGFDIVDGNLLSFFQEIQKAFGCVFQFDTINKTINIYELNQLGQNKGLYISDENYIKSLIKNKDHENIKTRLYLYGKNGVSIQSINITGLPYIENYTYFKNLKYMSQSLIDALNNYESLIDSKQGQFEGYLTQLEALNAQLGDRNDELVQLETELKIIEQNIDIAIADRQPISDLNTQKTNKEAQIASKKTEITTINNQISNVYTNINNLRNQIKLENNFTPDLLDEFDTFIREDTLNDSAYTEDNLHEFLEEGEKTLAKISQPPIDFEIDSVDFLNLVECQHDWDKIVNGDIVNIIHGGLGVNTEMRLVGYIHNQGSNSLPLKFSNRDNIYDATMYELDLIGKINTTSSTVDFSRFKWDKGEEAQLEISKYVNSYLDLSKQAIMKANNQEPILDYRGLWLKKNNADGTVDPNQIRAVNNSIVLTPDGWNNLTWALDPTGINAEIVRGKLGQFAQLQANQIIVGDNGELISQDLVEGLPYIQEQTNQLNDSMEELGTKINNAFSDNYITNIEANNLDLSRKSVIKEAEDIKNIAISLNVPINTITTAINSLNIEVNKYVGKSDYPIKVNTTDRTNILNTFTILESAIAQLYKIIDEKRDDNTRNYINQQIEELDSFIEGLQESINSYGKDLILTAVEANTIRMDLERVAYESIDLINIATLLEIVAEKNNYVTALNTLVNYLNMYWLNANYPISITQSQIDNVITHFKYLDDRKMKLINKISEVREQNTIDYVDIQVGEFEGAISGLQNNINEFSSDNKLTLAEANVMKISLDRANAEATDLINVATSLGIVAEKNNYSTALTTLTNYLNTNWLGKTSYPITITSTQRTSVVNYFKDVENKKSILINKIMEIRDSSSIKQGTKYNQVSITPAKGVVATHGDGSETILDGSGFKRRIVSNGNVYNYINLNSAGTFITTGEYSQYGSESRPITRKTQQELDDLGTGVNWVVIPNVDFKNRNFIIIPSLLDIGSFMTGSSGGSYTTEWTHYLETDLAILGYDYANGRFKIRARKCEYAMYRGTYMFEKWYPLTISYYVYAIS